VEIQDALPDHRKFHYEYRGKQYVGVYSGIGGWAGIGMAAGLTRADGRPGARSALQGPGEVHDPWRKPVRDLAA